MSVGSPFPPAPEGRVFPTEAPTGAVETVTTIPPAETADADLTASGPGAFHSRSDAVADYRYLTLAHEGLCACPVCDGGRDKLRERLARNAIGEAECAGLPYDPLSERDIAALAAFVDRREAEWLGLDR